MAEALDNLDIQYTYHVHKGSAGTSANGCYTKAQYHAHVSSCYTAATGSIYADPNYYPTDSSGNYLWGYYCNTCGTLVGKFGVWEGASFNQGVSSGTHNCGYTVVSCGKTTSTITGYTLGCGKTEQTIEGATIIY